MSSNKTKNFSGPECSILYQKKITIYTCNSCFRSSSFLASDLELLCTSKITAAPATYRENGDYISMSSVNIKLKHHERSKKKINSVIWRLFYPNLALHAELTYCRSNL
jgi:hypothetical protein